jgi:hypothetical protein
MNHNYILGKSNTCIMKFGFGNVKYDIQDEDNCWEMSPEETNEVLEPLI